MSDKLTHGVITPAYGREAGPQGGIVGKADFQTGARVQVRYA